MAIGLQPSIKPFASAASTAGIPLGEMADMVGDLGTAQIGNFAVSPNSLTVANVLTGQPLSPAVHDELRIDMYSASEQLRASWSIATEDYIALTPAAAGDTLLASGSNPTAEELEHRVANLLVGRTVNNVPLVQLGANSETGSLSFRGYALSYSSGLLERRLSVLQSHHTRQVVGHRRSAARPAAPTGVSITSAGVTFGSDGWANIETPIPTSTDPEWIADATASFSYTTGLWTVGTFTVTQVGSSYNAEYAPTTEGPWLSSVPTGDSLAVRIRRQDGGFDTYQVREPQAAALRWASDWDFDSFLATSDATQFFQHSLDWSDSIFLLLAYNQDGVTTRQMLIPTRFIRSHGGGANYAGASYDGHSRSVFAAIGQHATAFVFGGQSIDGADGNQQRLRLNFYRDGGNDDDMTADRIYLSRGYVNAAQPNRLRLQLL